MKETNILQKVIPSAVNSLLSIGGALLFQPILSNWKILAIVLFFLLNLFFLFRSDRREIGMLLVGTFWAQKYSIWNHIIFAVFYTLSFSTLLIWVWFPFDLFLFNILLLQLPFLLKTNTTFHGYISGEMTTVMKENKR